MPRLRTVMHRTEMCHHSCIYATRPATCCHSRCDCIMNVALVVLTVAVDNYDDDDNEIPLVETFEPCVGTAFTSLTLRCSPGSIGLTRREPRREQSHLSLNRAKLHGRKKYSRPYL